MIKKELLLKVVYGLVISYLIALLTFVTFKNFFQLDASNLSALGSMLSAATTCFAALVAYWLYNDWRAPHYLQKISYESSEIFRTSRQLKLKSDQLLVFVHTDLTTEDFLNSNTTNLEYKRIIKALLDDIDDIAHLLAIYKYNFNSKIPFESNHLLEIEPCFKSLEKLQQKLSSPHYIDDYIFSVNQVVTYVQQNEFEEDVRNITINLIDIISKFHVSLLKK